MVSCDYTTIHGKVSKFMVIQQLKPVYMSLHVEVKMHKYPMYVVHMSQSETVERLPGMIVYPLSWELWIILENMESWEK